MSLLVLQHTSAEYLGLMEDHLEGRNIRFRYCRPFTGKSALPRPGEIDLGLVLLGGGPWGSAGTRDLPTLAAEIDLVRAVLALRKPVLGIGLGAQILSIAQGGRIVPAPLRFGVGCARRTAPDALEGYLPEQYPIASYMRDLPLPPPGARVLAEDLEGRAVLLLASDPLHYGGSWTAEACQKVVRWVDFAETFHLPIVYLMDCPGFMIGLDAEKAATIRHGVRAMAAVNQTTVPWCTIIVRNAFGVAGVVHQPANRFSMRYAWPSAYWGSLPLEGGIEAAYRAEIDAAADPAAKLKEIEDRLNRLRSPFRSAEKFWVEEVIDPRKTRSLLCEFARLAEPLRTPGPPGNMSTRP